MADLPNGAPHRPYPALPASAFVDHSARRASQDYSAEVDRHNSPYRRPSTPRFGMSFQGNPQYSLQPPPAAAFAATFQRSPQYGFQHPPGYDWQQHPHGSYHSRPPAGLPFPPGLSNLGNSYQPGHAVRFMDPEDYCDRSSIDYKPTLLFLNMNLDKAINFFWGVDQIFVACFVFYRDHLLLEYPEDDTDRSLTWDVPNGEVLKTDKTVHSAVQRVLRATTGLTALYYIKKIAKDIQPGYKAGSEIKRPRWIRLSI